MENVVEGPFARRRAPRTAQDPAPAAGDSAEGTHEAAESPGGDDEAESAQDGRGTVRWPTREPRPSGGAAWA